MVGMRVLIQVVDALRVEERGTALDSVYFITLIEQKLRQICAILAGNAGNQSLSHSVIPLVVFTAKPLAGSCGIYFDNAPQSSCSSIQAMVFSMPSRRRMEGSQPIEEVHLCRHAVQYFILDGSRKSLSSE
jgi:hypothetical protein